MLSRFESKSPSQVKILENRDTIVLNRQIISVDNGFTPVATESISSRVFTKDGKVFKLNKRDSVKRQKLSIQILIEKLGDFRDRVSASEVSEVEYEGEVYTCVVQDFIKGSELKNLDRETLVATLKANKDFLNKLLDYFFEAIASRSLYPDIVGYPKDPEYFNSINLILDNVSKKLILCDVGLSPHEDTLEKFGEDFYDSENVKTYLEKMRKFREFLATI